MEDPVKITQNDRAMNDADLTVAGSGRLRLYLVGFRWLSLGLGFMLTGFNHILALAGAPPAVLSEGLVMFNVLLLLYHGAASWVLYTLNRKSQMILWIAADAVVGAALGYYFGPPYLLVGILLPALEIAMLWGTLASLPTLLILTVLYMPFLGVQWFHQADPQRQALYNLTVVMSGVLGCALYWLFTVTAGLQRTEEDAQRMVAHERQFNREEMSDLKREMAGLFEELEKRSRQVDTAKDDADRIQGDLVKAYEDVSRLSRQLADATSAKDEQTKQLTTVVRGDMEDMRRRWAHLSAVLDVAGVVGKSLQLDETLLGIADTVQRLIPSQTCVLFVVDAAQPAGELFAEVAASPYSDYFRNYSVRPGEGPVGWVAEHQEPLQIDAGAVAKDGQEFSTLLHYEQSALVAPLVMEGQTLGVFYLGRPNPRAYGADALELLTAFARVAAVALRNAFSYRRAMATGTHDPLTGLSNDVYFYDRLSEEAKRAARYHHPLTLALIQLDQFARLRERYGLGVGETVLREVAEILRNHTRETDCLGRLGPDTFGLLLIHTEKSDAVLISERIRLAIEVRVFGRQESADQPVRLTASIGLAEFSKDAQDNEELARAAGEALARSRDQGGNHTAFPPDKGA